MDLDNNNVKFMKNGKIIFDIDNHLLSGYTYFFTYGSYQTAGTTANFGQKPFRYTPPEGFGPITGASVRPETVIARPDQYVAAKLYTGTTANDIPVTTNFQPDLVWLKSRTQSYSHFIFDSIRGGNFSLRSDDTSVSTDQTSNGNVITFNSNGFLVDKDGQAIGEAGEGDNNMISWSWKAGGNKNTFNVDDVGYASAAAAGLDGGNINPTGASVGTKQGFSILKFAGTSSAEKRLTTGLNQEVEFYILKGLGNSSDSWIVGGNSKIGFSNGDYLRLNTTAAKNSTTGTDIGIPSDKSQVFVNVRNYDGQDTIVYCWHSVPGLQKFGTYVGNGSENGRYVELGFRPAVVIIKTISGGSWVIKDSVRKPANPNDSQLYLNTNADDDDPQGALDFLSNGFKLKVISQSVNASETYIYAAWAEAPTFNLYGGQSNAR